MERWIERRERTGTHLGPYRSKRRRSLDSASPLFQHLGNRGQFAARRVLRLRWDSRISLLRANRRSARTWLEDPTTRGKRTQRTYNVLRLVLHSQVQRVNIACLELCRLDVLLRGGVDGSYSMDDILPKHDNWVQFGKRFRGKTHEGRSYAAVILASPVFAPPRVLPNVSMMNEQGRHGQDKHIHAHSLRRFRPAARCICPSTGDIRSACVVGWYWRCPYRLHRLELVCQRSAFSRDHKRTNQARSYSRH